MPSHPGSGEYDKNDSGFALPAIDHQLARPLRVVMGLFDRPRNLISALQDLSSQGFPVISFCISGSPEAMGVAASLLNQHTDIDPLLVSLCRQTKALETDPSGQPQVGSQGTLFPLLKKWLEHPDTTNGSRCAFCAGLTGALEPHAVKGRLMLTVNATELTHLTRATRVLLQHSDHAVEMHEFFR